MLNAARKNQKTQVTTARVSESHKHKIRTTKKHKQTTLDGKTVDFSTFWWIKHSEQLRTCRRRRHPKRTRSRSRRCWRRGHRGFWRLERFRIIELVLWVMTYFTTVLTKKLGHHTERPRASYSCSRTGFLDQRAVGTDGGLVGAMLQSCRTGIDRRELESGSAPRTDSTYGSRCDQSSELEDAAREEV